MVCRRAPPADNVPMALTFLFIGKPVEKREIHLLDPQPRDRPRAAGPPGNVPLGVRQFGLQGR